MPLEFTNVEIVFRGLAQKDGEKTRPPDMLTKAINVVFDRGGVLNKRRGYKYVPISAAINVFDDDEVMIACATRRDELVVFSYDYVIALGSQDAMMRGADAFVYRGPNNRGNGKLQYVGTSRLSSHVTDPEGT